MDECVEITKFTPNQTGKKTTTTTRSEKIHKQITESSAQREGGGKKTGPEKTFYWDVACFPHFKFFLFLTFFHSKHSFQQIISLWLASDFSHLPSSLPLSFVTLHIPSNRLSQQPTVCYVFLRFFSQKKNRNKFRKSLIQVCLAWLRIFDRQQRASTQSTAWASNRKTYNVLVPGKWRSGIMVCVNMHWLPCFGVMRMQYTKSFRGTAQCMRLACANAPTNYIHIGDGMMWGVEREQAMRECIRKVESYSTLADCTRCNIFFFR